ncbi:hypothetical protein QUB70_16285 [Microcoleus sp. A003_D6]|uniref:beta strand repeat-containing protein n=1 Tax=Microcoleus sp. A003_D6 TaxID=3055266 RepID=UPI002FD46000
MTPGQVLTPAQIGQLFFQSTGDFTGATFNYSATDNNGAVSPLANATLALTGATPNQAPSATPTNLTVGPNSTARVPGLGGTDPDGSIASYTIDTLPPAAQGILFLGDPANGGVAVTAGQVLTPAQIGQLFFQSTGNFTGANFTYNATDNNGAVSPPANANFGLGTTPNQLPEADNTSLTVGPNSTAPVPGLGANDDGAIASYTINTLPPAAQGILFLGDPANGGVAVTPGQVLTPAQIGQLFFQSTGDFTGATFNYSATDNNGAVSPLANATLALTGATPNQAPSATPTNLTVGPNSTARVPGLGGNDPDGSIASYTIDTLPPAAQGILFLGDPANGGVAVTPGQVLTPAQIGQLFFQSTGTFTGANFTYNATDNLGAVSPPANANLGLTGTTPNQLPEADNTSLTVGPNSTAPIAGLAGSDPDGSIASYTINTLPPAVQGILFLGDPANGGVAVTPGQVLTPAQIGQLFFQSTGDFTGATFNYSATDNNGAVSPLANATLALTGATPNQAPSATPTNLTVGPNSTARVPGLGGTDPDGSIASYTIDTLPPAAQGILFLGDPANGGVAVTPGQVLTPAQIGQLFFQSTGTFTGANFTYNATDNLGAVSPPANATLGLTGATPNQPPSATNTNLTVGPNSSAPVAGLAGSDPDGSIASYTINTLPPAAQGILFLGDPANGGVAVTAGQVLTPAQIGQLFFQSTGDFTGATFNYSATDNNGAVSPLANATLALTGATPNQAPSATPTNLTVGPNSTARVPGLGGNDPDGSIASYTIDTLPLPAQGVLFLGDPANGGVAVTAGQELTPAQIGQLFFKSTGDFTGANFTYNATDDLGAVSPPANANLDLIGATPNQPPVPTPTPTPLPIPIPAPTPTPTPSPTPTPNEPPAANNTNLTLEPNSTARVPGLGISDDGSIASYTINTLPPAAQGVLFLGDPANGGVAVTPGQVLTPEQLGQLFFQSTGDFTGANFSYTATDNLGKVSPASATVILRPVGTVPPLTPTPTPTPAPGISNPIAEPDTDCLCQPIPEKPGINFAPPPQPPAVRFVRPISQLGEGQTTTGTNGDDSIADTKGNQKIVGFEGNDLLLGEDGADEIHGDEGNDAIFAGTDTDIAYGGDGNDIVHAGKQNDWIAGDLGADILFGDQGADTILGDNGNDNDSSAAENGDFIFGGNGADIINGNEGNDTIYAGKDNDFALGGKQNDLIWGELGSDTLIGDSGDDSLFGGLSNKRVSDSEGRDLLDAGSGNDFLNGQEGDDTLLAGENNDRAYGGKGSDLIYGELGSDTLYGGEGADTLLGDSGGSNSMNSVGEEDLLFGGTGNDIIGGGNGNDTVQAGKGNDCVWGGKDNDLIFGELGSDTLVGDSGDDTMYGGTRSRAKDVNGQDWLFGGDGADALFGDEGDDTISGGEDNDLIYGGKNNDLVHGDTGNDLIYGGDGSDEICGDEGNDTIFGDRSDNRGFSVGANDRQDCINGGDGDDLLYGNEGQDTINGDAGSDTLIGGKDSDFLNGGAGDDWLFGDLGDDTLSGGIGSDRFVLSADGGTDTVINFEVGVDKFVLTGGLSFQQLQLSATPDGTLLRVAGNGQVLANLVGVNGAIGSSDFLSNLLRSEG